jgi:hypothetical protein
MPKITEIKAITTLDNVFSQLQDSVARDRVLKWAWDKFATKSLPSLELSISDKKNVKQRTKEMVKITRRAKSPSKARLRPSIVKDLNLSPKEKKTFKAFVQEKQPKTNQEKCTVAVYYLRQELGLDSVSINHIFTCYKDAKWRVADLYNVLALTASRKGWVDTSNMESIAITTHGENLVEQDLPLKEKSKV